MELKLQFSCDILFKCSHSLKMLFENVLYSGKVLKLNFTKEKFKNWPESCLQNSPSYEVPQIVFPLLKKNYFLLGAELVLWH